MHSQQTHLNKIKKIIFSCLPRDLSSLDKDNAVIDNEVFQADQIDYDGPLDFTQGFKSSYSTVYFVIPDRNSLHALISQNTINMSFLLTLELSDNFTCTKEISKHNEQPATNRESTLETV